MANGIYVATSGTVARIQELEVLAHNLAHAKAPGFKRDSVTFESVASDRRGSDAIDQDNEFVQTREPTARLDEGPLTRTDAGGLGRGRRRRARAAPAARPGARDRPGRAGALG